MKDIHIDPVKEMQHLQAMYLHYKKIYRQLILICCSEERKIVKKRETSTKQK